MIDPAEPIPVSAAEPCDGMPEGGRRPSPRPETVACYRNALVLNASGNMPAARICRKCGVSAAGFRSCLHRYRRDLLSARHGFAAASSPDIAQTRIRGCRGQTVASRAKYGEAIAACGDERSREYNVSRIAHLFKLSPSGLANRLRAHYPELLECRKAEHRRRGLSDNRQRGARPWCRELYTGAVELLCTTELTLPEAVERHGALVKKGRCGI